MSRPCAEERDRKYFERLARKLGHGAAVYIMEDALTYEYWNSLTFNELFKIARSVPCTTWRRLMIYMGNRASSFEEHEKVHMLSFGNPTLSAINLTAITRMRQQETFGKWLKVWFFSSGERQKIALRILYEIGTEEDWIEAFRTPDPSEHPSMGSSYNSQLRNIAVERLREMFNEERETREGGQSLDL